MLSLVAKAQGQTTELGTYPEAEGQWGAVSDQDHPLQVRDRIWSAAAPPSLIQSLCRVEGGQGKGWGPELCPGEGAGTLLSPEHMLQPSGPAAAGGPLPEPCC